MTVLHNISKPRYQLKSLELKSNDSILQISIPVDNNELSEKVCKELEAKLNSENELVAHLAAKEILRYLKSKK